MIRNISYNGFFVDEPTIRGEQKSDGRCPNYAQGIQLSARRWLLVYDTVHAGGRDCWFSIFYRLLDGGPDGKVIAEERLFAPTPFDTDTDGAVLALSYGEPIVFGVAKGATHGGQALPHANHFVLTWIQVPIRLLANGDSEHLPMGHSRIAEYARMINTYHLQFRLNDAEDALEITQPPERLTDPTGRIKRFNGWTQPLPANPEASSWLDSVTVAQDLDSINFAGHNGFAVIQYDFEPARGLYQWRVTGDVGQPPANTTISETNLAVLPSGDFVLAVRSFQPHGNTLWYRTSDPFSGFGEPTLAPDTSGQRYVWMCPDGELRIFNNRQDMTPYGDYRNPLYCFCVDPETFAYRDRAVVLDTRMLELPIPNPFVDHMHLYAPVGDRQVASIRVITKANVWRSDDEPAIDAATWQAVGSHKVSIEYDEIRHRSFLFDVPERARDGI